MEDQNLDKMLTVAKSMADDGAEFMFVSPVKVVDLLTLIDELKAKIKELENVLRS